MSILELELQQKLAASMGPAEAAALLL